MFSALAIADSSVFLTALGDALARELQVGERRRDLLAADQARHEVELLRAHPNRAGNRSRLVVLELARGLWLAHRYFLFAFLSAP